MAGYTLGRILNRQPAWLLDDALAGEMSVSCSAYHLLSVFSLDAVLYVTYPITYLLSQHALGSCFLNSFSLEQLYCLLNPFVGLPSSNNRACQVSAVPPRNWHVRVSGACSSSALSPPGHPASPMGQNFN